MSIRAPNSASPQVSTESPVGVEEMRGLRAGTIVFLGIAAGNVGNYLFHFISARLLGPAPYASLS